MPINDKEYRKRFLESQEEIERLDRLLKVFLSLLSWGATMLLILALIAAAVLLGLGLNSLDNYFSKR